MDIWRERFGRRFGRSGWVVPGSRNCAGRVKGVRELEALARTALGEEDLVPGRAYGRLSKRLRAAAQKAAPSGKTGAKCLGRSIWLCGIGFALAGGNAGG